MPGTEIINALTVDFEDWYHGLEIPPSQWSSFEDRIVPAGRRMLGILDDAGVKATFFVLGAVAERHPEIVREIAAAGHEIATHGFSHTLVYRQTPEEFRSETRRALDSVEQITGERILGHRAPFFSITSRCPWAFDILGELGLRYDTSVFPVMNYRYGNENAPRWPYDVGTNGHSLQEFPISTWRILGKNLPVGGGAYFRILPYLVTRSAFRSINRESRPAIFYVHPWELDPHHPRIDLPRRIAGTHYFNLRSTERRLVQLLRDFRFAPLRELLDVR